MSRKSGTALACGQEWCRIFGKTNKTIKKCLRRPLAYTRMQRHLVRGNTAAAKPVAARGLDGCYQERRLHEEALCRVISTAEPIVSL
jgi:hypothetical protein